MFSNLIFFLQNFLSKHTDAQSEELLSSFSSKYYYYTRTKGLFRICYPKERPPKSKYFPHNTVFLIYTPIIQYHISTRKLNIHIPSTGKFVFESFLQLVKRYTFMATFISSNFEAKTRIFVHELMNLKFVVQHLYNRHYKFQSFSQLRLILCSFSISGRTIILSKWVFFIGLINLT